MAARGVAADELLIGGDGRISKPLPLGGGPVLEGRTVLKVEALQKIATIEIQRLGEPPLGEQPLEVGAVQIGVGDLSRPMVYYECEDDLEPDLGVAALEQPLVPCEGQEARPCDVIATQPEDAAGIWKHYAGRPDLNAPGGMGYQRINRDGSFVMADAPEHTTAPFANWPYGSYAFEDSLAHLTVEADGVPPMCRTATQRFHVYRYGEQPVALLIAPVEDDCPPRLQDTRVPFVWVAPAAE